MIEPTDGLRDCDRPLSEISVGIVSQILCDFSDCRNIDWLIFYVAFESIISPCFMELSDGEIERETREDILDFVNSEGKKLTSDPT